MTSEDTCLLNSMKQDLSFNKDMGEQASSRLNILFNQGFTDFYYKRPCGECVKLCKPYSVSTSQL